MLLFVQILGGLGGLVFVIIVMHEIVGALHDMLQRRKIIKQRKKQRELQAAKDLPFLQALEDPQLIELGGPRKALPGNAVTDPFRGIP